MAPPRALRPELLSKGGDRPGWVWVSRANAGQRAGVCPPASSSEPVQGVIMGLVTAQLWTVRDGKGALLWASAREATG